MYSVDQIQHVHLEISSRCNAACPLCPRNLNGYPYNDGYIEHDMTLDQAKIIFQTAFLQQIKNLLINGNFGDAVMNPATVDIVRYFRSSNPDLKIMMSTNGGARDREYWQSLAKSDVEIMFCIDGLEDTHHLYRQNTLYQTVMRNAEIFIAAGGRAIWKMIKFDHNTHQIKQAQLLSQQKGFAQFRLIDHGRNQGPVFDQHGNLVHVMGQPMIQDFPTILKNRMYSEVLLEDILDNRQPRPINCQVKKQRSIYVSSTGDVYPCCYLGFDPKTYGHGNYHAAANAQFRDFVQQNNALEYNLSHCIAWFGNIENTWTIPTFEQGRLIICNDVCGKAQDPNK